VDDVAIRLEHVDLLDLSDGLHVHLLEGSLELLVVGARRPVDLLLHTSGSSLAAVTQVLASILVAASFSHFASAPIILNLQCSIELRIPRATTYSRVTNPALKFRCIAVFVFQALHSLVSCVTGLADVRLTLRHGQHGNSINFASFPGAKGTACEHSPVRAAFCMRASFSVSIMSVMWGVEVRSCRDEV
jgi:hypothetical protein